MNRRGRPNAAELPARREAVLEAAVAELVEHGYAGLTMDGVARRAGASKATLYAWFGDREGLLRTIVERAADASADGVALDPEGEVADVLGAYAERLLDLLTSPRSIALNRAAAGAPDLAALLLASGRHRIGPVVEAWLAHQDAAGRLHAPDPVESYRLLYGLIVRDTQIRVLLGDPVPSRAHRHRQARAGVEDFLALSRPTASRQSASTSPRS